MFDRHKELRLIVRVHLLHEMILFRVEEMAVLPNMRKPTQRIKENEKTKGNFRNKRIR